jgi:CRISPR-associated endoribonuclease Cas6
MELKLKLKIRHGNVLPVNYQYELSSWIYKVIARADETYSSFLHEKGFTAEGRTFKMFTFSQLDLRPFEIIGDRIKLQGKEVLLTIRFMVDRSLDNFVKGLFINQQLGLGDKSSVVDFEVSAVETAAPFILKTTMQYHCLSPICVSRSRGDGTTEYLFPSDPQFGDLLIQNLIRKEKALALTNSEPRTSFPFNFRLLNTPRKKGIHIKANRESHTQVIGYLFHFELQAPTELHEIGYYAGFGEKNSMGFGCVTTPTFEKF